LKILLSEARPDYAGYVFPYAVWGFLEPGETPATALSLGFLPSGPGLSRFYLCRQVRVPLDGYRPSSENRRILRKGDGFVATLLPIGNFEPTEERLGLCLECAAVRWSSPPDRGRIERIFRPPATTHVLSFRDGAGSECGLVSLYLERTVGFYSNAFHRLDDAAAGLGMYQMTETVRFLAEAGFRHLHLGTCYSTRSLYKTAFQGVQFFDGIRWSGDLAALKHMISRQETGTGHLLEDADYLERFVPQGLERAAADSKLVLGQGDTLDSARSATPV
jgi:hypothetical protein